MSWTRIEYTGAPIGTCKKCKCEVMTGYKLESEMQNRGTMPAIKTKELVYCDACAPDYARENSETLHPPVETGGNVHRIKSLRKVLDHEWSGEMTDGTFIRIQHRGGILYLGAGRTPRQAANNCTNPVAEAAGDITETELLDKLELQMEEQ